MLLVSGLVGQPAAPDAVFLQDATKAATSTVQLATLATTRGRCPATRALAHTLAADERRALDRLHGIATSTGVSLPRGVTVAQRRMLVQLQRISPPTFDSLFTAYEVAVLRARLDAFRAQAVTATSPALRTLAAERVVTLDADLRRAQQAVEAVLAGRCDQPSVSRPRVVGRPPPPVASTSGGRGRAGAVLRRRAEPRFRLRARSDGGTVLRLRPVARATGS